MSDKLYRRGPYGSPRLLAELIDQVLYEGAYDGGRLEGTTQVAENCSETASRLIRVLHRKGILTLDDISDVLNTEIIEAEGNE